MVDFRDGAAGETRHKLLLALLVACSIRHYLQGVSKQPSLLHNGKMTNKQKQNKSGEAFPERILRGSRGKGDVAERKLACAGIPTLVGPITLSAIARVAATHYTTSSRAASRPLLGRVSRHYCKENALEHDSFTTNFAKLL